MSEKNNSIKVIIDNNNQKEDNNNQKEDKVPKITTVRDDLDDIYFLDAESDIIESNLESDITDDTDPFDIALNYFEKVTKKDNNDTNNKTDKNEPNKKNIKKETKKHKKKNKFKPKLNIKKDKYDEYDNLF